MEKRDIYDKHRVKTGKVINRGDKLLPGECYLAAHVCIVNSQGQLLIQRRQPSKKWWPNMWDVTAGGSAHAGEDSLQTAERELFEEIGYRVDLKDKEPLFTIDFGQGFDDYFGVKADLEIKDLRLQEKEVKAVKWVSKEELLAAIEANTFIPYHRKVIDMIFDMQDGCGAYVH